MADEAKEALPYGSSMTMDEIEESIAEGTREDAETKVDQKLEGEAIPETFRGKTVDDVIKENQRLQDSLRLRDAEASTYKSALESRRSDEPAPVALPAELTREELQAMYDTDPLAAVDAMQAQALRRAEAHLSVRLGSLEAGTVSAAESMARDRYKEEFELFGDEITKFQKSMPNQGVFSTRKGWDDMISYIRGQEGNIEKIIEKRSGGSRTSSQARDEESRSAGSSRSPSSRGRIEGGREATLEQKQVAEGLGMTISDYLKWDKVGR